MNKKKKITGLLTIWSCFFLSTLWAQLAEVKPLAGEYYKLDKQTGGIFELNIQEDYHFDLGVNQIGTCTPTLMYYGQGKILALTDSTLTLGFDTVPTQKSHYTLTYLGPLEQQIVFALEATEGDRAIVLNAYADRPKNRRFRYLHQSFEGSTTLLLKPREQFYKLELTQAGAYPIALSGTVLDTIQTGRYQLQLHFRPSPKRKAFSYLPASVQTVNYQFIHESPLQPHIRITLQEVEAWYDEPAIVLERKE
ncbi:MAG: hypothetical protein ACRBFS_06145 [Aureispira sp.]